MKNLLIATLVVCSVFGLAAVAQAQGQACTSTSGGASFLCNALPSFGTTVPQFLSGLFTWLGTTIATLVMFMIIFSGIQMMMAQGDKAAITKAKNNLTYSVIGMVVVICAYVIVAMIELLVGVNDDAPSTTFFFNPLRDTDLFSFVNTQILRTLTVVGTIALMLIVVNGFRYIISDNEEQTKKAKEAITWSVIGLVVVLISYTVIMVVLRTIQ